MSPSFETALADLVAVESPSDEPRAVEEALDVLAGTVRAAAGDEATWTSTPDGPPVLAWHRGDPDDPRRVLLLGHADTVWPIGTLAERAFAVDDSGRAYGPGVFDMKAGLVIGVFTLAALDRSWPVSLVVTGDEEIGSPGSREAIAEHASRCQASLVLEGAGPDGALKSRRKGRSVYTFRLRGLAAHAGLEPERGRNALVRLASLVHQVAALSDPGAGRSVTPTRASAGRTVNTVPDTAELSLDVRVASAADQEGVDRRLHGLAGTDDSGVEVSLSGGIDRPPMEAAATAALLDRVATLDAAGALPVPPHVAVGGISDANLTAAAGVPTLDGLGAVGGGAHADHEWVDLDATRRRVDLVTSLVATLVAEPLPSSRTSRRP